MQKYDERVNACNSSCRMNHLRRSEWTFCRSEFSGWKWKLMRCFVSVIKISLSVLLIYCGKKGTRSLIHICFHLVPGILINSMFIGFRYSISSSVSNRLMSDRIATNVFVWAFLLHRTLSGHLIRWQIDSSVTIASNKLSHFIPTYFIPLVSWCHTGHDVIWWRLRARGVCHKLVEIFKWPAGHLKLGDKMGNLQSFPLGERLNEWRKETENRNVWSERAQAIERAFTFAI